MPAYNADVDFDSDGNVDGADLAAILVGVVAPADVDHGLGIDEQQGGATGTSRP